MPVPENRLKAMLNAGQATTGLWLSLTSPYVAELAGYTGFDWLMIDGEHAPNDIMTIMAQLQVLKGSSSSIAVRPPVGETHLIKQLLDIGAQSLLIPMVESGEQAEKLVRAVRYPPHGIRGVGASGARASNFGNITDYMATADSQICLMLQIESRAGMAALDAIATTDGVDCVFIGPSDLAADMGFPGNPFAPEVQAVIEDAIIRIRAHGKAAGVYMGDPDYVKRYLEIGATMIAIGSDAAVLARGLKELNARYKLS
ncbi:HpcH/HpaI aldolase/citrate lyase family protein [Rhizobium sp. KVB221]|uniref:HpcH/HpaI aldolase/citrate lyase family protein n=1 Tax=Rhizobium setariae TaxID=2801340 RepID=A0A936YNE6_9HYPH|nr:HpcH/HpaI aldolase/citrate lyase family protein [Rhizobium setariae]MBL0372693.1 HpcH/HpaI aldolase/citrate lyase family protein [Rhizobium setariae]